MEKMMKYVKHYPGEVGNAVIIYWTVNNLDRLEICK